MRIHLAHDVGASGNQAALFSLKGRLAGSRTVLYSTGDSNGTWAHRIPGLYVPNGTMQCAAGCCQWLKSTVCWAEGEQASRARV